MVIGLSSCHMKEFKEARAETKAKREVRMQEYADKAKAEEEAKEQAEREALAKARAEQEAAERAAGQEAAPVGTPQLQRDSLLLQFDRRPCFGRCEVYKIKMYESGYVLYEGINFVERMGVYQARLSPEQIAEIYAMLARSDFFKLEDKYDDPMIMDLPSMIFKANAMGQQKRIIARYDVPEALTQLAKEIDAMSDSLQWKPYIQE